MKMKNTFSLMQPLIKCKILYSCSQ